MEEGGRDKVISVGEKNMSWLDTSQHWCISPSDSIQPIEIQLPWRREPMCLCRISTDTNLYKTISHVILKRLQMICGWISKRHDMEHLGLDKVRQERDMKETGEQPILERRLRDGKLAEVLKQFKGKLNVFQIQDVLSGM